MKSFFKQLFKDKNGYFSLRELAIAIFILVTLISWVAQQFFRQDIPDFMFYSIVSLVAVGCFGYSIEKKTNL